MKNAKKWIALVLLCCPALVGAASNGAVCSSENVCLPGDTVFFTSGDPAVKAGTVYEATLTSAKGSLSPIPVTPLAAAPTADAGPEACTVTPPQSKAVPSKKPTPDAGASESPAPAPNAAATPKGFCLKIRPDITDGIYTIKIAEQGNSTPLSAISPAEVIVQRPVITSIWPEGAFQEAESGNNRIKNEIVVLGKGFRRGATDNGTPSQNKAQDQNLELRFRKVRTPDRCGNGISDRCYEIKANSDQQVTLTFYGLNPASGLFLGKTTFVLAVGGVETNESTLTLIHAGSGMPMTAAIIGLVLIIVVIYLLLHSGREATKQEMNGKTYWLTTLFLDPQTSTYSLSKCQFYAWTLTAIFGYLYLAVSKSVVQGSGVFPDIPPGLPGILLASVATVVLSTGITSAKGNKGAGNPGPNLSDFIATGGVITPDRLQFAVWTIIGIGTFLGIVIQTDPRNISDLPAIPSGFMQLMGISSAGYLAGKLARKAGPVISALAVRSTSTLNPVASNLRFEITGTGLSRSAIFTVDDQPIFPDPLIGDNNQKGPQVLKQDSSNNDPDFASVLTFTVPDPPAGFLGKHKFTIINPDAQKAVIEYQVFKVNTITIAGGTLTVDGECLDGNLKLTCTDTTANIGCGALTPAAQGNTDTHFAWTLANPPAAGHNVAVAIGDAVGGKVERTVAAT